MKWEVPGNIMSKYLQAQGNVEGPESIKETGLGLRDLKRFLKRIAYSSSRTEFKGEC